VRKKIIITFGLTILLLLVWVPGVSAVNDCDFTTNGSTMTLNNDCTTDATILIPDGFTLDGKGHTITGVDPAAGHFVGAVVQNGGGEAYVKNLVVTVSGLANACDNDDDRLRGIMFEGASGSITHTTVTGINQGPSGCQEGNGIEVRNAPFDGTHPDTMTVDISHNTVEDYQKTGIVANGDVYVTIQHNKVGESATQDNLAANSIQVGFGGSGSVTNNNVDGNQWKGTSDYASAAILIYLSGVVDVSNNNIRGNSDIGLYGYASDSATYNNNRIFDEGSDHPNSGYDYGLGSWGVSDDVTNNKVKGFEYNYDGVIGGNNKEIPGGPID